MSYVCGMNPGDDSLVLSRSELVQKKDHKWKLFLFTIIVVKTAILDTEICKFASRLFKRSNSWWTRELTETMEKATSREQREREAMTLVVTSWLPRFRLKKDTESICMYKQDFRIKSTKIENFSIDATKCLQMWVFQFNKRWKAAPPVSLNRGWANRRTAWFIVQLVVSNNEFQITRTTLQDEY